MDYRNYLFRVKVLASFCLLAFLAGSCEKDNNENNTLGPNTSLFGADVKQVHFINEKTGFAVTYWADIAVKKTSTTSIYKTDDSCKTWKMVCTNGEEHSSASGDFGKLHFVDDSTGFIYSNYIYKTIDQGENWKKINSPEVYYVFFSTPNIGFCAGWFGSDSEAGIGYTTDGGMSWVKYPENTFKQYAKIPSYFSNSVMNIQFLKEDTSIGFITFNTGEIYRTKDGGILWEAFNYEYLQSLDSSDIEDPNFVGRLVNTVNSVLFLSESEGYIFNDDGIYQTTDSGQNFNLVSYAGKPQHHQFTRDERSFSVINENEIYFAMDGEIFETRDRFQTFNLFDNSILNQHSVLFVNDFQIEPEGYGFIGGTTRDLEGVVIKFKLD